MRVLMAGGAVVMTKYVLSIMGRLGNARTIWFQTSRGERRRDNACNFGLGLQADPDRYGKLLHCLDPTGVLYESISGYDQSSESSRCKMLQSRRDLRVFGRR